VLIALYVAVWREPRKARSERDDRKKQLTALQRAEDERVIAQARRVVASVGSASLLGNGVWFASVSNHSTAPVTNLEVKVFAVDAKGERILEPCKRSKETIGTDDVLANLVLSRGMTKHTAEE